MKNNHYLPILFSIVLLACDDEDQPDRHKPVIGLQITQNGSVVDASNDIRGIVQVNITAEDDREMESVKFYVDDQLVEEVAGATLLEKAIDTRQLEDDSHELKVIVTDHAGNHAENITTVRTKNLMFLYRFPTGHYRAGHDNWIVLSDAIGKVFEYQKVTAETDYRFLYPLDYSGNDFDFTLIERRKPGISPAYSAATIKNMAPGEYRVQASAVPNDVGQYTLSFSGVSPDDFHWQLEHGFKEQDTNPVRISLSQPSSDLFIAYSGDRYYYDPEVHTGEQLVVDQAFIDEEMRSFATQSVSGSGESFLTDVWGVRSNGTLCPFIQTSTVGEAAIVMYPTELIGNGFTEFKTYLQYFEQENVWDVLSAQRTTGIPTSLTPLQAKLSEVISADPSAIKLSLTGNAERILLNFYPVEPPYDIMDWRLIAPFSSTVDTRLPELPASLLAEMGLTLPTFQTGALVLHSNDPGIPYNVFCEKHIVNNTSFFDWTSDSWRSKTYLLGEGIPIGRAGLPRTNSGAASRISNRH